MAKMNFTKIEEALAEGLRQFQTTALQRQAESLRDDRRMIIARIEEQKQIFAALKHDLSYFSRNDPQFFKRMGMAKEDIRKLLEIPDQINEEMWNALLKLRESVQNYKKELEKDPAKSNEKLVESERHKHVNKRFNISDTWLPLS